MTLIQTVAEFCRRQGISVPAVVTTSTDETILQIWGLVNETIQWLADRHNWLWLRTRYRFNHANGTDYLALTLASVSGYRGIVPKTLWAEDLRIPLAGPMTPQQWQQMVLLTTAPARYAFRIYGGGLYIYPAPASASLATTFFSFEYDSEFPVVDTTGATKALFTADSDQSRLPDRLIMGGLRWRWKKEKQQAYAEEMRDYELMVANEAGRESAPGDIRLDEPDPENTIVEPGLLIPAGNWNVT